MTNKLLGRPRSFSVFQVRSWLPPTTAAGWERVNERGRNDGTAGKQEST